MKILILKNKINFNIVDDCQKAMDFFSTRLPFKLEFDYKDVSIPIGIKPYTEFQGFNTTTGKPQLSKFYGLIDSVKDTCRLSVKENEYDIVILAYDMDTLPRPADGVITSFTTWNPLYKNTEYIQLAVNNYLKQKNEIANRITHELCHAFSYASNRNGFPMVDQMDSTEVEVDCTTGLPK